MRPKLAAYPLTALSHKAAHLNDLASNSSEHSFLHHAPIEFDEAGSTHPEPTFKPWTPLMLQRWVLQTISIVLLTLIVTLEIVLKSSTDRHGFGPVESNLHYVWTYGPTAGTAIANHTRVRLTGITSVHSYCCFLDAGRLSYPTDAALERVSRETTATIDNPFSRLYLTASGIVFSSVTSTSPLVCIRGPFWLHSSQNRHCHFDRSVCLSVQQHPISSTGGHG